MEEYGAVGHPPKLNNLMQLNRKLSREPLGTSSLKERAAVVFRTAERKNPEPRDDVANAGLRRNGTVIRR
jgi:hypothetical protein